jgi:hypothetical protein
MFLKLHAQGYSLGMVLFGSYNLLILIGYLIFRSTFLPRILGGLLAISGLCYLINCFAGFLSPASESLSVAITGNALGVTTERCAAVEVPLWMPSGKKLVLFTCLTGCVVIAGALAATALANHKQAGAAVSAVAKPAK